MHIQGLLCSSYSKESACNAWGPGSIPGSGRSPGEENGTPLQYSCLENPMDREAWRATVHGVSVRRDWVTNTTSTVHGQIRIQKVRKDLNKLLIEANFSLLNKWFHNEHVLPLKNTLKLFPLNIVVINMSIIDESCSRERTLDFGLKVLFGVHSTIFSSWVPTYLKNPIINSTVKKREVFEFQFHFS